MSEEENKQYDEKELLKQINEEWDLASKLKDQERSENERHQKLIRNYKDSAKVGDKDSIVGDPLMISTVHTTISALAPDVKKVEYAPMEDGDRKAAEQMNAIANYDDRALNLKKLREDWLYQACLFPRALVMQSQFDIDKMVPVPTVVNMFTWYRDPSAISVNGDGSGFGAMKFGGREIMLTKEELERAPYFNAREVRGGESDEYKKDKQFIDSMSMTSVPMNISGDNREYTILEWFTFYRGDRVVVGLANSRKNIVRFTKLKQQDKWGITDYAMFPNGGTSWNSPTIASLVADNQVASTSLKTLMLHQEKSAAYPMYTYNSDKIKNPNHLNIGFNKMVPVSGEHVNAISPVQRINSSSGAYNILNILATDAQKATAISDIQQGVAMGQTKSATEISLTTEKADSRLQHMAELWTDANRIFWEQHYLLYKEYMQNKIHKKIIRLSGSNGGYEFRDLTKEQISLKKDPDVIVESKIINEAQRLGKLKELANLQIQIREGQIDGVDNKELIRIQAEESGLSSTQLRRIFPLSADEMLAQNENEKLNKGEFVPINPNDDDLVHIRENGKASEKGTKKEHVEAHWEQLLEKKKREKKPERSEEVVTEGKPLGSMQKLDYNKPQTIQTAIPTT